MPDYFRIQVRLLDVKPKLWRRFLIAKGSTFLDLHEAIQDACGWENSHLFMFRTPDGGECIAGLPEVEDDPDEPHAARVLIADAFGGQLPIACDYQYDFGDDWHHEVTCEAVERHEESFARRLLEGAGTFPPEDCGGPPGYQRCVAVATGKGWAKWMGDEKERKEVVEWLGAWKPAEYVMIGAKQRFDG